MLSLGTARRIRRLSGPQGHFFLLALDHGLPAGPLPGIEDLATTASTLGAAPFTGIIVNPGMMGRIPLEATRGLVVHLSAGTLLGTAPSSKVLSCSVERAFALGADAVSVQIQFGDSSEGRMLADAGRVADEAGQLGVPVVVMAYPPGATVGAADPESARHAARAAAELGADIVQVPHPGSPDRIRALVRGCPVPVIVAGGPRATAAEAFLESVEAAMAAGAAGISVGRNVFQHPDPAGFARRIGRLVLGEAVPLPVAEA